MDRTSAVALIGVLSVGVIFAQLLPTITIPVVETGLNSVIYRTVAVSSVYNALGKVECSGVDGTSGLQVAHLVIGLLTGKYVDFGGSSLCNQSCSGSCVDDPVQPPPVAPASAYPFSCDCPASGCNSTGPIPPESFIPGTMVRCSPNSECTCGNLQNNGAGYKGYLCNWWNVANGQEVYIRVNEVYSPIRWCDCCPA